MELDTPAPQAEPIAPPQESDDASLADHEAAFGKGGVGLEAPPAEPVTDGDPEPQAAPGERDDKGRFRHRAKKDYASPADVPRIAELTKRLRDAERRAEDAERRATARPEPERRAPEPARAAVPASEKFTFPAYDEYLKEHPDTDYDVWQDAKLDARDEWSDAKKAQQSAAAQRDSALNQGLADFNARDEAFRASHPDYDTVINASTHTDDVVHDHPALNVAVFKHDKSAEIKYYLAQHPEFFDEMLALTYGKPVSDSFVALVQRRLSSRLQAAPTGSAAPIRTPSPAPRPPNPVRTGPMNTGEDLPGDESSLAEHERAFGPKRSRR